MIRFNSYTRGYEWLSNFSDHDVYHDAQVWPSVEHAYQAAKTLDPDMKARIWACMAPGAAKRLGKHLELRPNWEFMRVDVMRALVLSKFERHPELRDKLVATGGTELFHLSPWDQFWGVNNEGIGHNMLGVILTEVRERLRCAPAHAIAF